MPTRADSDSDATGAAALDGELSELRGEVARLRTENARLLELTPRQARPPGPTQTATFDTAPGAVAVDSPPAAKVAFYAALFGARTDVYALRWQCPNRPVGVDTGSTRRLAPRYPSSRAGVPAPHQ